MASEPHISDRAARPYVAIRATVGMDSIGVLADRLPEVFGWLDDHGIEPADAPFFKYNLIDMLREMVLEVGVPVAAPVRGSGDVIAGVLPAGRYVSVSHVGHPEGLMEATAELLDWADDHGLRWDRSETEHGERWGCRLEVYHTDPRDEPDMTKWHNELLFRLAD